MAVRAYISNIATGWSVSRQEALLAAHIPTWPTVYLYRDILDARLRRAHSPLDLVNRATMLRATGNQRRGETIYVASLAVLAWSKHDFEGVLAAAETRGTTIVALDGEDVPSVSAFAVARRDGSRRQARENGLKASAAVRRERADIGCQRIADLWGYPTDMCPTSELLKLAGEPGKPLSYNTVVARLGGRETAQRNYARKMKRHATMEAKNAHLKAE